MKYYFIAGEASGDLHASNLIHELIQMDDETQVRGFGGELMEEKGMQLVKHYREMAFMGVIPVLMNLRKIRDNFRLCEKDLLEYKPDVLILVDYPGFNLRMAEFAKANDIRVFYYISPKIWAWKSSRIKKIKAFVDEMFTILPFETEFYKQFDYPVTYVGNPVLDAVQSKLKNLSKSDFFTENNLAEKPVIALLPGSRLQEIKSLLPRMLKASSVFNEYQLIVTGAPNISEDVYRDILKEYQANLVYGKTYEVLQHAKVAALASGTVSLEAGIIRCPQIVCYRMGGGMLVYYIGKLVFGIGKVSLVNLILNRYAVKELLQHYCSVKNIRMELNKILKNPDHLKQIKESYEELHEKLGSSGASKRAAEAILEKLQ